ncbi:amidohydrolase [Kineobactrum sediminis]|uniref:amidohydrolase n=1 Tax=Kineobactrum sediminis TaxID=1905677 RepID=UPI001F4E3886|nr:amidohydrolase [Kineobactrum sediminis]
MSRLPVMALCLCLFPGQLLADTTNTILSYLEREQGKYAALAHEIWEKAELGYLETRSSRLLQEMLAEEGFTIESGVAGMPTAFVASYGSGEPIIGILAEFDALPGISQTASPKREPDPDKTSGHACGHHLFGAGSTAAAIAVRHWMQEHDVSGTVRLYGTPAEEGGSGKVYMVREGLFAGVAAVLAWHPSDKNAANPVTTLANKSAKFGFHGVSSHAAVAPERGRSALDAVEAMNHMANMMREHIPQEARMHYVITRGGSTPNVVPDFAEVFYYLRHPDAGTLEDLWERLLDVARGAALGTGTEMVSEVNHGNHSMLPNETLAEAMYNNLVRVGGVKYDDDDLAFASELAQSLNSREDDLALAAVRIEPMGPLQSMGSTDVGDVSWQVPTSQVNTATWVPGTAPHTWQAIAAGGTAIGHKGMLVAAKTLALTAGDLFLHPALLDAAKEELEQRRGKDFEYQPLLGDRDPPLDYRR